MDSCRARSSSNEVEPRPCGTVLQSLTSGGLPMKTLLGISLLGATLLCGPALAQSAQPDRTAPAATTTTNAAPKLMLKGNWRASKLMGLDVYNDNNEKLGDV